MLKKRSIRFNIVKSLGNSKQPYNINDNDYFWLNFPNKKYFILIPSQNLYDNGLLSKENCEGKRKKSLQFSIEKIPQWIQDYVYEYRPETERVIQDIFSHLPKIEPSVENIDIDSFIEDNDLKTQEYLNSKFKATPNLCIDCDAVLNKFNAKRCVTCKAKNQVIESRDNGRPSYLMLIKDLETNTYEQLGYKYGVSKVSIFKWLKTYEKYNLINI